MLLIEMGRYSEAAISETIDGASAWLGYGELRESQLLAATHFLRGKDVFVSLPTRSGKSLCFYLLPKAFDFLRRTCNKSIV